MQTEAQIKTQLMAEQFQYDLQLAQMQSATISQKEADIEDRKDKRTKLQATQQSAMINQRQNNGLPQDFESQGEIPVDF
jgi:predicted  nucleic acid-binding Zn-ribbon protein